MNDTDLKKQVAITSLNAMMRQNHFSICTIDTLATMLEVKPEREAYNILRPLHCIDYNQMPPELFAQIPTLIMRCLDVMPTPKIVDVRVDERKKMDFMKRLNSSYLNKR